MWCGKQIPSHFNVSAKTPNSNKLALAAKFLIQSILANQSLQFTGISGSAKLIEDLVATMKFIELGTCSGNTKENFTAPAKF
jgi:hypothetical protein